MLRTFVTGTLAALTLSACVSDGGYNGARGPERYEDGQRYNGCDDNAAIGMGVGAIAGGVIGNQFGKGRGKAGATIAGVILGGIAGNAIGRGACQNDRADAYYYNNAYADAFDRPEYGRRYEWRNPHNGNYGYVTPMRRADRDRRGNMAECREFTQTVYVNGYETEEVNFACRTEDGRWRIVGR